MGSTRVACLCIVLAVCAYGVASLEWEMRGLSSFTVPVFMWSDRQIFSKSQVLDTVSTGDVDFALASLLHKASSKNSKLATSFNEDAAAPEVVILFVEPELRTDQVPTLASAYASTSGGSFSNLKSAVEAAGSSLVLPYASVDEVTLLDETLLDTIDSIKEGNVFLARVPGSELFSRLGQLSGVTTVEIDSLMSELKSNNVFGNGVTDVVIVCFDKSSNKDASFAAHDSVIGEISTSIKEATKGNYVAVYTANMPDSTSRLIWTFDQHSVGEYQLQNAGLYFADDNSTNGTNNSNNTNSTGRHKVNYFPGPLLEAFLLSAILLAMLFTGACAIFSLQTPDKWEAPKVYNKRDL